MHLNKILLATALVLVSGTEAQKYSKACKCGFGANSASYNVEYVKNTVSQAISFAPLDKQPVSSKSDKYPRTFEPQHFGGSQALGLSTNKPGGYCQSDYRIFPLLKDGTLYDSQKTQRGEEGPDAVVYDAKGNFCGCITHRNMAGNRYAKCT
ncbi:hypothetical protein BGZ94_006296 [Podila epigama]|nr:hypothetical protein BGZ94_006296 [Podila epigama]